MVVLSLLLPSVLRKELLERAVVQGLSGDLRWELDLEESQVRVSTTELSVTSRLINEPPKEGMCVLCYSHSYFIL